MFLLNAIACEELVLDRILLTILFVKHTVTHQKFTPIVTLAAVWTSTLNCPTCMENLSKK